MGSDRERNPLQVDTTGLGPETRGIVGVLVKGFQLLAALLRRSIDMGVNLEIIRAPETFAFLRAAKGIPVTPGTVEEIAANAGNTTIVVYVRAETYSPGLAAHLILDTDKSRCTLARARVVKHSITPEAKVLLEPNQKLYADVTDSSGGLQATFRVTVSVLPLVGAALVFPEDR